MGCSKGPKGFIVFNFSGERGWTSHLTNDLQDILQFQPPNPALLKVPRKKPAAKEGKKGKTNTEDDDTEQAQEEDAAKMGKAKHAEADDTEPAQAT